MRENSSRLLTSFCRRSALRKTTLRRSACSPSPASASASSAGPRISDSGVRNSWLTLEKKSVFARSSSASASARSRSASRARTLARLEAIWPATSSRKPRYSWSSARYGFRPATSSPAGSGRPESASGIASAWRGGSSHAPSGHLRPVEVDHGGRAVEPRDLRPGRRAVRDGHERAVVAGRVGERERQVQPVAGQAAVDGGEQVALARGRAGGLGQLAQGGEPALAQHAVGLLDDHAQHPGRRAVLVAQRAVGERVVGLLAVAAALEEQPQARVPGRGPGRQHLVDARADVVPDLRPDRVGALAERPRVLGRERVPRVGVVVEERQLRAPRHPHREARAEHDPHRGLQALRPALDGPERRGRPVVPRDPLAHVRVRHPASLRVRATGNPPGSPASR